MITQIHEVYIKASPQAIWDAITKPEWTERYGMRTRIEFDLRPGGAYRAPASEGMKQVGVPELAVVGEVVEVDPPHRLVQTWHPQWEPIEQVTRITYQLTETRGGVTKLTVTHELYDATNVAAMVGGHVEGAGGGWPELLSDLKSLLETGSSLYN